MNCEFTSAKFQFKFGHHMVVKKPRTIDIVVLVECAVAPSC